MFKGLHPMFENGFMTHQNVVWHLWWIMRGMAGVGK